jgi:transposase
LRRSIHGAGPIFKGFFQYKLRQVLGFALGRKSWLFAGSERGADRTAAMATLIMTAKLNDVDPLAWLADVLGRIAGIPQGRLHELLPWNWSTHARSIAPPQAA